MNVASILWLSSSKHTEATAVVDGRVRLGYGQLLKRVMCLAGAMKTRGIGKGKKIAMMLPNCHQFVEVYFAALATGAVAVPVNFRFLPGEIRFILEDSRPDAIFYHFSYEDRLGNALELLPFSMWVVGIEGEPSLGEKYEELLTSSFRLQEPVHVMEEDLCQIMYTSGTTGMPKGALIPHRAVLWNLVNTMHGREDREGERALVIGPMYHTAALNNHLTIQIALGGTSILVRSFEPELVLKLIEKERATTISGAPTMYHMLMDHPGAEDYDLSSITKCTSGASVLPLETLKRLQSFFPGIRGVYDVYGCTEASPTISILRGEESRSKPGSVGRPVPFVHVEIVDEEDNPLQRGEVGELVCRGPNVMLGYHNNEEASVEVLRNGWLHTGDLAMMDDAGFIYIVDRKKDVIISGGENIYPREVEEVLLQHPGIADAAVVGTPDPTWGEAVHAFVVVRNGWHLREDDVVEHCKAKLASYKKPRKVSFVQEIPRNPSGKILKTKLKELIQE